MNQVFVLHLEQVNHKQVVRNKLDGLLRLLALLVCLLLDEVHTAVLAIAVPPWWEWASYCGGVVRGIALLALVQRKELLLNKLLADSRQRDDFLCVVCFEFPPQYQGVGDLAPVWTTCAYPGIEGVHRHAGVRPFDLSQLLVHPIWRVWVHL